MPDEIKAVLITCTKAMMREVFSIITKEEKAMAAKAMYSDFSQFYEETVQLLRDRAETASKLFNLFEVFSLSER